MAPHPGLRPCVGIVLIDRRGRIFLGRRSWDLPRPWQMPQGGIDDGEQPLDAALRELHEETGVHAVRLLAESRGWLAYRLPPELAARAPWGARWSGQTQRWFAFAFEGDDREIRVDAAREVEFVAWRWATADEVLDLVVEFKRPVYQRVLDEFRPLLQQFA